MRKRKPTEAKKLSRLTHSEVLELFQDGLYSLHGESVHSRRTGKAIHTFLAKGRGWDENRLWLRLYSQGRMRSIQIAHIVWIVNTGSSIPPGFEIHHIDLDPRNNAFENLVCLHEVDHRKIHRLLGAEYQPSPTQAEEVPF